MSKMMKAAVVRAFGQPLYIEDAPVPVPGPGQVLVKIEACGVCHTDLHAAGGEWPVKPNPPFIPGHEGVGYVAEVGPGVKHVRSGDRVGVPWLHSACGHCPHCLGGWETLCESQQNTGYSVNGGFAEYALAEADYVGVLPDNVGFVDIAPILCAGVTVYKGLKGPQTWYVEAHQFRIDTADGIGRPTPEGAHRDGVDFVAVILIGRENIKGGETRVFEANGPKGQRFTMTEPWTLLLLDDAAVIHESTPIQPVGDNSHRDTLVLTWRAGAFQGDDAETTGA
ncbi:hypothetical protein GCM10025794_08700 [Massilia kyonggiensis]